MDKQNSIDSLLNSLANGEEHVVKINVDTTLNGVLAVQYKLLKLLRKEDFDEKTFINMLLICGLAEISRTLLKELLSIKGITHGVLQKLFNDFEKTIKSERFNNE